MNYALLGYGVVGTGIVELIEKAKQDIDLYKNVNLKGILVKDENKHVNKRYLELVTEDINNIFSEDIDVIIEVMGGVNPAYKYVKMALIKGIHVITANKDLIAEHGSELSRIAKENNVTIKLEAAVAGGVPIIKPLVDSLSSNKILSIKGILNGTTNFILTKMYYEGINYDEALKEAQRLGFAEANPESDVMGYDTARKLSILSSIAFNGIIYWKDISIEGISDLDKEDFLYAKKQNCCIKLVAYSAKKEGKIYGGVKPMLVDSRSEFFGINDEVNSVVLEGDAVGELTFTGKGAGMFPTASAVCSDLSDIINRNFIHSIKYSHNNYSVEKYLPNECEALIRITTEDIKNTKKLLELNFNEILEIPSSKNNEIAVVVRVNSEIEMENRLDNIKSYPYVSKVKSLIKFDMLAS
ncbi:homoserine dehydrogenase [Clostridium frigidicarnis]|uniref:Homoserine dehydrogenase n=1 Tax=Clostridium frigidicarnis TaxID=84698 RepID=A0A1I1B727_9CLOT|nr:homoserine dehydrogenase [Clostridium frigidicarnis]SFB44390.1 homoserine dehydrogenase [Clostridium frigidicarnis]